MTESARTVHGPTPPEPNPRAANPPGPVPTRLANITYASGEPQHGPGWACGYSGKKLVTQCAKGGRVGEWDTYKDNPGSAPEATNDNALCYKNGDYFDPSQNY